MAILVTGGAGFIGSHTCVELLNAGYDVVVVDNLCNSSEEALRRVEKITGKKVTFYQADIRDGAALDVAYCLDHDFVRRLRKFCDELKPDFFLVGETYCKRLKKESRTFR